MDFSQKAVAMKILLTTNTFKTYKRQDIAVQSYKKLKELYPDNVDLLNIQFKDEFQGYKDSYDMPLKFALIRSSLDIVEGSTKKLPFVKDLFDVACENAEDYFIFTNSDVIINKNLIDYILEKQPECFACSRLDIVDNLNDFSELKQKAIPVRWEIAGFDTFIFKKSWYQTYSYLFHNYLLGKPEFDHVYAGIMKCFGDNTPLGNQYPPFCFHIHHGMASVMEDTPERDFNVNTLKTNPLDSVVSRLVFFNLKHNLCRRTPWGSFLNYDDGERERERITFEAFNLKTPVKLI
jgi:hypothetical protein